MANAINFIDGLDGLAAGIVGIAAAAFFLYSMQLADAGLLHDGNAGPLVAGSSCSRSASGSCPSTSTRPGSSWATAARCCSGC